jgi:small subunit ribosomal protein S15
MNSDSIQSGSAQEGPISGLTKAQIIASYARKEGDVGSPEVQVALLTKRIQNLSGHFESHRADKHSKRGMMALITRRKSLLKYLRAESPERYRALIASLGLRK